jgi:hypothetical protein
MQSPLRPVPETSTAFRGLQFLIEPEPCLRVFLRNVGDLFRPGTKDRQPIDIEAVVRVPFRVPRSPF